MCWSPPGQYRGANGTCRLSLGIRERVGNSGRSESILGSARLGGILWEVRWTADAELSHSVHQRRPLHSQSFRSAIAAAHYPIARFERSEDMVSLNFRET